jgi:DNA-nicking Smr family endonuclease
MSQNEKNDQQDLVEFPIDGILDLHTFQPKEVKDLVPEFLTACREQGIHEVRIIHGKGMGVLQRTVHSILKRLPEVLSFHQAGEFAGNWGATIVKLHPLERSSKKSERDE